VTEQVRMSKVLADDMIEHCRQGRPNEACGMLGRKGEDLVRVFKMINASASPVRYALDPKEQLHVYNALDDTGLELGGVFHSHTRTEAYPSPTDVRLASEDVPYLIVSLMREPPHIRAFRILKTSWDAAHGEIVEIPVTVTE
jgi:proteasome lid subunit RPN8/RPN11